jgi:hypothetical protein
MFGSRQFRRVAHTCFSAVPAVFLLSITANSAFATCGDYLMLPGEEHTASAGESPDHMPHEGPAPCNGPGCKGVPQAPLPTAPERSQTNELERWCASLAEDAHSALRSSQLDSDETLLIPSGFASRIDRPPRG